MSMDFFDQFKPRFRELLTDTSPESVAAALETIVYEQGWDGDGQLGDDGLVNIARVRQLADVAGRWIADGLTPMNPVETPRSPVAKPESGSVFSDDFEPSFSPTVAHDGGEDTADEGPADMDSVMADLLAGKVLALGGGEKPEFGEGDVYADEENAATGVLSAGTPADRVASLWERAQKAPML